MRTLSTTVKVLTFALFILAFSAVANAQTRTWVSGVGDDLNPCSRTAPCKTFAGAISKTADKGEIDCLDPGGFGTVTITKSITIDGTTGAGFGSILAAGTTGVNVNDSATATPNTIIVKLRNLSIQGVTTGINGINFSSGATLHVENCRITGFTTDGIHFSSATASRLTVEGTTISECNGDGLEVGGLPASHHAVTLNGCTLKRNGNGVSVTGRADVTVSNSVLSLNNASVSSAAVIVSTAVGGTAVVDLESCQMNSNSVGVQPNAQSAIRLSNVHMTGNANALNFNGGTIASYSNNKIFGNTGGENFAALTPVQQH